MRGIFSTILLALLGAQTALALVPILQHRADCNADNCARAVSGSSGSAADNALSARRVDCASFLLVTAIPATSTVTSTVSTTPTGSPVTTTTVFVYTTTLTSTHTVRDTLDVKKAKRASTDSSITYKSATTIPSYLANSCGTGTASISRYSSACSCLGVRGSTSTAAAPLATTTSTITANASPITATTTISTAATTTITASCPARSYSSRTKTYSIRCNFRYSMSGHIIDLINLSDVYTCIDYCEDLAGRCQAVNYYHEAAEGNDAGDCYLLGNLKRPDGKEITGVYGAWRQ